MTRDEVFQEFTRWTGWPNTTRTIHQTHWYDTDAMADEILQLRRILAALRQPSEAVVGAAFRKVFESEPAWEDQCRAAAREAIVAAVAAAEKEAQS